MSEWISVKERLPDDRQNVLVYTPLKYVNETINFLNIFTFYKQCNQGINYFSALWGNQPDQEEITYWMPLPDPPELKLIKG